MKNTFNFIVTFIFLLTADATSGPLIVMDPPPGRLADPKKSSIKGTIDVKSPRSIPSLTDLQPRDI
jgi:hypothetical protein